MPSARGLARLALALCTLLAACGADELTELIVVVDSDLAVPTALDEISILVEGASGIRTTARASLRGADAVPLPVTLGLRPGTAGAASVTIRADGLLAGVRRMSSEVRTSFVPGRRLVVRITLRARCVGVVCGEGDTCAPDGGCVSSVIEANTLPAFTGALPRIDLGVVDAGPTDLGPTDLGAPDLGPSDLGPSDLGPSDLGPSDLGPPIDAGPPNCDAIYGTAASYRLCIESATECEFYTLLAGQNCRNRCEMFGRICLRAYSNDPVDTCLRQGAVSCGNNTNDNICVCSRPASM